MSALALLAVVGWAMTSTGASAPAAVAEPPVQQKFAAPSSVRVGLVVGTPLGVSVAVELDDPWVLHVAAGGSTTRDFVFLATADFVARLPTIMGPIGADFWVMPFVGIGARLARGRNGLPTRYGGRVPFGLSLMGTKAPIEVFTLLALGYSAIPDGRATAEFELGLRFSM